METLFFIGFLITGTLLLISMYREHHIKLRDVFLSIICGIFITLTINENSKKEVKDFKVEYEIEIFAPDSVYIKTQEGDLYKRRLNQLEETIENDNL